MLKVKGCTKILYLENPLLVGSIKKFMKLKNESADSFFFLVIYQVILHSLLHCHIRGLLKLNTLLTL